MSFKRILVTGGAGLVGSSAVERSHQAVEGGQVWAWVEAKESCSAAFSCDVAIDVAWTVSRSMRGFRSGLATGSSGLIGPVAIRFYAEHGQQTRGDDDNRRWHQ
jgi:hypothetical protein